MVIATEKEALTKPLSFVLKKARSASQPVDTKEASKKEQSTQKVDEQALALEGALGDDERGTWTSQWDFVMSCIAYAVGLGNVWRFPYLCFKNGGGAFLIPYFIAMFTCGIPLFLLEVSIGQYLGVGGMNVIGQICPIFKGVGYSAIMMVFLESIYYIIIVAWTMFYIINTLLNIGDGLPWSSCAKGNGTWADFKCYDPEGSIPFEHTDAYMYHNLTENNTQSPVEEYWRNAVLKISSGIDDVGGLRWELAGYLAIGWITVYFVVWKGLHNSSKVIWCSAIFPYIILSVLCVKSLTLDGAFDGLKFLFTPDWERLKSSECWIDGGTQIFFSYGVGIGALLALGSYNKFHHNCYRDAMLICTVNTGTSFFSATVIFSILGFMAKEKGVEIADVVKSGPGLAFLVYPEVVNKLAPSLLWALLFFFMLFILGIDSQFCCAESLITGIVDNWPGLLRKRRMLFTTCIVIFMFFLGLPMITQGGMYIFRLMDFYAASGMSLLWCTFFQTIAISWIFGAKKMYNCIELMIGHRINWYWFLCWVLIAPIFMIFVFLFYFIKYTPIMYGKDYHYPKWGEMLGFMISLSSMIWVPGYFVYYLLTTPGTLMERLKLGITPVIQPRADAVLAMERLKLEQAQKNADLDVELRLVDSDSDIVKSNHH